MQSLIYLVTCHLSSCWCCRSPGKGLTSQATTEVSRNWDNMKSVSCSSKINSFLAVFGRFLPSWLHLSLSTCCSTCSSGFGAEPLRILSGSVWECWLHLSNFDFSQANMLTFTLKVQHKWSRGRDVHLLHCYQEQLLLTCLWIILKGLWAEQKMQI